MSGICARKRWQRVRAGKLGIVHKWSLSCLSNHRRIIAHKIEQTQETFLEERDATGCDVEDQGCQLAWGVWCRKSKSASDKLYTLSALRIKFVGSVNNKKLCSKYWISRNLFRLTGRWEKGKNSVGPQTVIGKSSDRDIKTCLHKPRPFARYNLHTRHCKACLAWVA